jgi:hypothetical protein
MSSANELAGRTGSSQHQRRQRSWVELHLSFKKIGGMERQTVEVRCCDQSAAEKELNLWMRMFASN